MAKALNSSGPVVNLTFMADTKQASAQLKSLQTELNNILKTPSGKLSLTDDIQKAISATAELSTRLHQATNVDTGNLDFSKFNNSLKQSGQSLSSYGQQLQKLGPTGQQAFLSLAKSVASAEIPMKRTSAMLKEFTTTLANTARWQLSSSILHGFMGAIQSAYGYAQDLNESLNNIRIVTGQTSEQMARFAEQANSAARALSATTVEYTNASLIYYQQGLNDQQVKERTDVTIKMANVTKQSAEVVSDQLTAIWNNFYDGTKSLEYYADVMTALGAATASSSDEIAGGLEKFAALGETIGLSYEYAASALATITSNTRQSEEVVGTALKTIFARIQGLELGETLEDGVDLNKYSKALQAVGISIFEQNGELKAMDNILDEMGDKWDTLSKAQQNALAQTVAGVRQYTQLVSLMDNWNKSDADSMKSNLNTAYNSSGSLDTQADTYAEGWEAAQKRVQAAAESIYSSLLNDDFFIDILNGFEKVLGFVDKLIDNLGGLKGVFFAIGTVVTKVFSAQLSQGLSNMAYNLKMMTQAGRDAVEQKRKDFIDNAVNQIPQSTDYVTPTEKAQQDSLKSELTLQQEYLNNSSKMSTLEAETNKKLMERTRLLKEQTIELAKQKESVDDKVSKKTMDLRSDISAFNMKDGDGNALNYKRDVQPEINKIKAAAKAQAGLAGTQDLFKEFEKGGDKSSAALAKLRKELESIKPKNLSQDVQKLLQEINQMGDSPDPEQLEKKLEKLNEELEISIKKSKQGIKDVVSPEAGKKVDALTDDLKEQAKAERDLKIAKEESNKAHEKTANSINNSKGAQKQWSDVMVESANVAFSVASAISMVNSAIDTLKDPDVSGMQKLLTVVTTMSMVLPTVITLVGSLKKLFSSETIAKIANAAATWAQVAAEKKLNQEKGESGKVTKKNIKETIQDTKNKIKNGGKNIKENWNKSALEKRANTEGSGYTKHKNGTYSVKGQKGIVKAGDAANMAGKEAAKALGAKVASAGIAAAGIAVIIGTVAMVVNQMNKAEKAVEKAKASAQALSEGYDTAKASYDEFINAQTGYESAREGLDSLTKGTLEYKEALLKANDAAAELLMTNDNLTYTIENGQIIVDPESIEKAKEEEYKQVEAAQAAKMAGQTELKKAELELEKRDMARDLKSNSDAGQKAGNSAAGGVLGAVGAGLAAGGIAGMVGGGGVFSVPAAIVGAVVGGVAGLVTGIVQETSTKTETDAMDVLAQQAENDETFLARLKAGEVDEEELKEIGIDDSGLIASLQANGEEVAGLIAEMQANTAAINAQNDLVAANALADNEAVANSKYQDQIIDIAGDAYGKTYDNLMENADWLDSWGKDGISKATGVNDEAEDVFKDYLKYAGLENQGYELTDTKGTDKNREFVYKDAEGNEKTVSLEAMQAARAAYEASNTLNETANQLAETFDNLADSTDAADQALLSFLSKKDFEDATKGEFDDIKDEVGTIEKSDDGTYTEESLDNVKEYLNDSLGEELTDDVAAKYGYESAEAMIEAFADKLSDAEEAWEDVDVPDNLSSDIADNMSLGTAEALESQIDKLNLGPKGEQAGKDYVESLNSVLGQIDDEDDVQAALNEMTNIDWTSPDAIKEAKDIMEQYGVEIDTSSQSWQDFISAAQASTLPDFSTMKDDLQNVSKILNNLDFGSIISDEDYQKLVDYNDEWADFFVLQADGSRKFIGDQEAMLEATRNNIAEQRKDLQENKENIKALEDSGADWSLLETKDIDMSGFDGWMMGTERDVENNKRILSEKFNVTDEDKLKQYSQMNRKDLQNNLNADKIEDLATNNEAFKNVLTDSRYDETAITEILQEARDGNTERLDQMLETVDTYMGQDLDVAEKELDEMMASTATSIADLNNLFLDGQISADAYSKQLTVLAQNATTLEELQQIQNQSDGGLDPSVYGQNLLRLAENYANCAQEAQKFEEALASGNSEVIKSAQNQLEASIMLGEAAEKYGFEAKEAEIQAKQLAKAYNLDAKAAAKLAIQNQRMNKGVSSLNSNWKDWSKALKATDKTTTDWAKAASEATSAIADLVGASEDLELPDDFFDSAENMALLEEAANGSEEAINKLGLVVASSQIQMMEFSSGMKDLSGNLIDEAAFNGWKETLLGGITNLQTALDGVGIGDNVYEQLGGADWVNALNEMAVATKMSVEEMNSLLDSMGVETDVTTTPVTQMTKVPVYETTTTVTNPGDPETGDGRVVQTTTVQKGTKDMEETIEVAQINTGDDVGTPPKITYTGNGSVSPSSTGGGSGGGGGGGGSSSKPKTVEKDKRSDMVERYKEVNDQIDDITDAYDRANRAANRLWGADKIKKMQEANNALKTNLELTKQRIAEGEKYLEEDRAELEKAAQEAGITLTFDDKGNITNYTEQFNKLYDDYARIVDQANADGNVTEEEQEAIDKAKERYEKLDEYRQQYEDTRESIEDDLALAEEQLDEWQSNNFDILNITLEMKMEVNTDKLELVDYYIGKMEDDVYSMGEALALMTGDKLTTLLQQTQDYQDQYEALQTALKNGEINEQQYKEGIDEIQSGLLDSASALKELDDQTIAYYEETLSAAQEEINKYIEALEHLSSVLEHYSSILDLTTLTKKSTEYFDSMDKVLEGQAQTAKNTMEANKRTYEMFQAELVDKQQAYEDALKSGDEDLIRIRKEQYEAALAASNDAEEQYLSSVEAYAEKVNAILENNLNKFANALEDKLTGGTSFDQMNTSMERFVSLHEEYLTTTNKVYETTKLMNTAQKEIDKTSNTVAKNKMKQFIQETQNLQNQSKLSQFELDIQQAKYDLLVAEIALEEARDAKSQVRLQRDSEGNFGYVYTANQETVQNAEQAYLDAQNKLYNVGLEGANGYVEKYQQTMSEMYDTLADLAQQYRDGEFASEEEYQNAVKEATEYYYEKLDQYSYLHYQALQTDSAVATDYILSDSNLARTGISGNAISVGSAWRDTFLDISGFGEAAKAALEGQSWDVYYSNKIDLENMTGNAESWKEAVTRYITNVSEAFSSWKTDLAENVTPVIGDLGTKVGDVVTASNTLRDALVGTEGTVGIIDKLQEEIDKVNGLTDEYIKLRDAILESIAAAEKSLEDIVEEEEEEVNPTTPEPETPAPTPPAVEADPPVEPVKDPEKDGDFKIGDKVKFISGYYYHDSSGSSPRGSRGPGKEVVVQNIKPGAPYPIAVKSSDSAYGWLKREQLEKFDTGGYTGEWEGPYGKIAMLHQKELVLKEKDTENFLASLEVMERILQMIDLQSTNLALQGNLSSPTFGMPVGEALEQNVHIEASFPGVSDRNEIEEAFKDLVNLASQYANRK